MVCWLCFGRSACCDLPGTNPVLSRTKKYRTLRLFDSILTRLQLCVCVWERENLGINKRDLYQKKNGLLLLLRIDSVTEMILMLYASVCVCVCVCVHTHTSACVILCICPGVFCRSNALAVKFSVSTGSSYKVEARTGTCTSA